jgi:hypothetical protein
VGDQQEKRPIVIMKMPATNKGDHHQQDCHALFPQNHTHHGEQGLNGISDKSIQGDSADDH